MVSPLVASPLHAGNLVRRLLSSSSRLPIAITGRHYASELNPLDYDFMATSSFDPKRGYDQQTDYNPKGRFMRQFHDKAYLLQKRYQPAVYRRVPMSTKEYPNRVETQTGEDRIVGCVCEKDSMHVNYFILKNDGRAHRCECGVWYKITDAKPDNL